MNREIIKISSILIMLFTPVIYSQQSDLFNELFRQYDNKDYFRFIINTNKNSNSLNEIEKNILFSLISSISNKPLESNRYIDSILNNSSAVIKDTVKLELYETMLQNSLVLYEYSNATRCAGIIMKDYKMMLDSNDVEEYDNMLLILEAVKDLGKQSAEIKGDTRIKTRKDMAGMINIPLKINGKEEEFIFDTGANISTIKRSFAEKLKLVFLKGTIKVGSMTGIKVDAELAYAADLDIGNIHYKNVLFLVVPDDVLTFAGGLYSIDGIIGNPLFMEMKEIHLSENELFIPVKPNSKPGQNLVMDGLTPVVNTLINKDTLALTFDTGARTTILYNNYYLKYKSDIDKKYEKEDIEFGGAGGNVKVKGFKLDEINVSVAGSKIQIDNIRLLAENVKESDKYFYGNLGQDYIKEFSELIINLESMYVEFKK